MQEIDQHDPKFAWFCLRSQLKHEYIAAAQLRQHNNIDVFVPSIRFKRTARYGSAWVTEALFPNYVFARFDWTKSLRLVHYSPGICEVVHFGCYWPESQTGPLTKFAKLSERMKSTLSRRRCRPGMRDNQPIRTPPDRERQDRGATV